MTASTTPDDQAGTVLERLATLDERLAELAADRDADRDDIAFLKAAVDQVEAAARQLEELTAQAAGAGQGPVDLAALADWVRVHIAEVHIRPVGGQHRWCAVWWQHPEAVIRLEACRRAWTRLVTPDDPTGMSVWLRDHLDPALAALLAPTGPFRLCEAQPPAAGEPLEYKHRLSQPLPVLPLPADLDPSDPADLADQPAEHVDRFGPPARTTATASSP
jgi:hypothetical protein